MKIPVTAFYVIGAVLFGLVAAFGISAMTYHPLPVQVQVNQYVPVKAPEPVVPTIAPVVRPTGPFAPAPAPVVVTTQPLPSITPVDNSNRLEPHTNCNITGDTNNDITCLTEMTTGMAFSMIFNISPIVIIIIAIPTLLQMFNIVLRVRPPRNF